MAGLPQLGVTIDFTNGPAFISTALTLDSATLGKIGTGQLADAISAADISADVLQVSIRRGRNRILDTMEAGTATVILKDETGAWNPSNPASPYYGKLLPLRKIQIYADYNGVRYVVFTGYVTSFPMGFVLGADDTSKVTLQCVDAFRLFNNTGVATVASTPAGQLSGARVGALLDDAAWPSSLRAIDTGNSTLQADDGTTRTLLSALQLVEKSEFGGFYVNAHGLATFYSRSTVSKKADATPTVFADDGTGIAYQGIEFGFDDTLVLNDVTITRAGGAAQNVFDQPSIDTYFVHSGTRSNLLVQTDTEARNQAAMVLQARKDAVIRIDSMSLNLYDPSAVTRIAAGLSTELFDLVNITKAMPGSTSITRELFVQGIQHDMTPKSWVTKILTSEPIIQAFIVGSATQGVLGGVGVLSY